MNPVFSRVFNGPATPIPAVQLLSNGRYHVMITNAGGGYSRWKALAVNLSAVTELPARRSGSRGDGLTGSDGPDRGRRRRRATAAAAAKEDR